MSVVIDVKLDTELVTQRTAARIVRESRREVMEHHGRVTVRRHFMQVAETAPGGAYGYSPRSRKYKDRKEREGKGRTPNVFSGRLRDNILQSSKVTATQKRARWMARNSGHFALNLQRRRELEAVSAKEEAEYARMQEQKITEKLNDPANQRKRRVKG